MVVRVVVAVRDFGPFEQASLEFKPLTVIVGRNSVGKSMLAYLVWALAISMADFSRLGELAGKRGLALAEKVLEKTRSGSTPLEEFRELVRLNIELLPKAIASSVESSLKKVFGVELGELVRVGADRAVISVDTGRASLDIVVGKNGVQVTNFKCHLSPSKFVDRLEVEVVASKRLRISYEGETVYDDVVASLKDVVDMLVNTLIEYMALTLAPLFGVETFAALLPDSRAGVSRVLLKPYPLHSPLAKTTFYPDEHFVNLYYRLAEALHEGLVELELVKPLLEELGCSLEPVLEAGVYNVYVRSWTGKRVPLSYAPSGVRELLTVALALAAREEPYMVVVEEPEAHLHSRAQKLLARLIARAVNELGKWVLITTHSDYIVYTMSNLIALSQHPEKIRELGYAENEALNPNMVAAYLVKAMDRGAIVERLAVGPEGIPEDKFTKIAEELAEERARILA